MDGFYLRPHINGWLVQGRGIQVVDLSNRWMSLDRRRKEGLLIDWWTRARGTGSAFSPSRGRVCLAHALQVELWHLISPWQLLEVCECVDYAKTVSSIEGTCKTLMKHYDAHTHTHTVTYLGAAPAPLWAYKVPTLRCPPSQRSCLTVRIDRSMAARHSSQFGVERSLDWDYHHAKASGQRAVWVNLGNFSCNGKL